MKLLIITQKINNKDDHFTFFLDWITEFSKHFEKVTVIALWVGDYDLPKNVEVYSLGKENGQSRIKYIFNFYKYVFQKMSQYESVFVHMNPEYVVLGGFFWRLMNKKVGLWYVHRHVDLKLKIAERLANVIFTVVPESFTLKSKKVKFVGHGINTDLFKCSNQTEKEKIKILSVSRITEIKNLDVLIEAADFLKEKVSVPFEINIISKLPEEKDEYYTYLRSLVSKHDLNGIVNFVGAIPGRELVSYYCGSTLTINLTPTGGVDKTVLESMSCGVPVLSSNAALTSDFGKYKDILMFKLRDSKDLAQKIFNIINKKPDGIEGFLRERVKQKHQYVNLIDQMSIILNETENNIKESRYFRAIKYIISGGTAAFVNLILLFLLTDFFGIWYLSSAVLAFAVAFIVSFILQKLWTFEDDTMHNIEKQLSLYLSIALANLAINTAFLYVLVDIVGVYYLFGQIITSGSIALYSFFVYRHFIFNKNT